MKLLLVAAARPNFMKIAPLIRAIDSHNASATNRPMEYVLVHTGQHYDYQMSQIFFQDLQLPQPHHHLGVGSGTHAEQTGKTMIEVEKVLIREQPDLVVVVGDVNASLAAALATVKLRIPLAHVEAGLRSFDREMPEEINRILTDAISDYLFTPSADADTNLEAEGIAHDRIFFVGNVMVDSLLHNKANASQSQILSRLNVVGREYALLTLHRPSNVEDTDTLMNITNALTEISRRIPIVFPAHPRTRKRLAEMGLLDQVPATSKQLHLIEPLGYTDFLHLEMNATFVMTDSGGVQEETTVLDVPCLTIRNTTERPITIAEGTNLLVGKDAKRIVHEALEILNGRGKRGRQPLRWDGRAAERIVAVLAERARTT